MKCRHMLQNRWTLKTIIGYLLLLKIICILIEIVYLYLRDFGFCILKAESVKGNDLESQAMCLSLSYPFHTGNNFLKSWELMRLRGVNESQEFVQPGKEILCLPPCPGQTEDPESSGGSKKRRDISHKEWRTVATCWEDERHGAQFISARASLDTAPRTQCGPEVATWWSHPSVSPESIREN